MSSKEYPKIQSLRDAASGFFGATIGQSSRIKEHYGRLSSVSLNQPRHHNMLGILCHRKIMLFGTLLLLSLDLMFLQWL